MTVARTRVVLAMLPGMLGDIVRQLLADAPDLYVAAELSDDEDLCAVVRRTGADVVVTGIAATGVAPDGGHPVPDALARALLCGRRGLTLVALTDDARAAYVYELRLHETVITEISPRRLLDVLHRG